MKTKTKKELDELHRVAAEISITKHLEFQEKKPAYKDYNGYPNVLCVFQTHNKAHLLKHILAPFLTTEFRNIVLFADGCQDESLMDASALLNGKNHVVVAVNDLHEVSNYRTAINSEWARTCKYMLLMQDDDIYPDSFSWLDEALSIMERDDRLVVIGFADGMNYVSINPASETFETDEFYGAHGRVGLPRSYEATIAAGWDGRLGFQYCDCVNRAPNLIKISEFKNATSFEERFEPYYDDDTNYCLELWSKGLRVGILTGVPIYRNVGIGGMRLNGHLSKNRRPAHAKRNHNYIYTAYGELINSGKLREMVCIANSSIAVGSKSPEQSHALNSTEAFLSPSSLRRNAPCPCGSGKKYKHCHGSFAGIG